MRWHSLFSLKAPRRLRAGAEAAVADVEEEEEDAVAVAGVSHVEAAVAEVEAEVFRDLPAEVVVAVFRVPLEEAEEVIFHAPQEEGVVATRDRLEVAALPDHPAVAVADIRVLRAEVAEALRVLRNVHPAQAEVGRPQAPPSVPLVEVTGLRSAEVAAPHNCRREIGPAEVEAVAHLNCPPAATDLAAVPGLVAAIDPAESIVPVVARRIARLNSPDVRAQVQTVQAHGPASVPAVAT